MLNAFSLFNSCLNSLGKMLKETERLFNLGLLGIMNSVIRIRVDNVFVVEDKTI
jgi:hypothetical protein